MQIYTDLNENIFVIDEVTDSGVRIPAMLQSRTNMHERIVRYKTGIEVIKRCGIGIMTEREWHDLFCREIGGFAESVDNHLSLLSFLSNAFTGLLHWWGDNGMDAYNPTMGMAIAMQCETKFRILEWEYHTNRWKLELADPDIDHRLMASEQAKSMLDMVERKAANAIGSGRRLVSMAAAGRTNGEMSIGFGFAPMLPKNQREPVLTPFLIESHPTSPTLSDEENQESRDRRGNLAELIFYECLRVMAANARGPRCPMRTVPWAVTVPDSQYFRPLTDSECCGRFEQITRLWEAGRMAGLPEDTWHKPTECSGCSRASVSAVPAGGTR